MAITHNHRERKHSPREAHVIIQILKYSIPKTIFSRLLQTLSVVLFLITLLITLFDNPYIDMSADKQTLVRCTECANGRLPIDNYLMSCSLSKYKVHTGKRICANYTEGKPHKTDT